MIQNLKILILLHDTNWTYYVNLIHFILVHCLNSNLFFYPFMLILFGVFDHFIFHSDYIYWQDLCFLTVMVYLKTIHTDYFLDKTSFEFYLVNSIFFKFKIYQLFSIIANLVALTKIYCLLSKESLLYLLSIS